MTVPVDELIRVQYLNIPGLSIIEGFAYKLLLMGLLFSFSVEVYRGVSKGRCDFLTWGIRAVAAGFLLTSLLDVGLLFDATSKHLAGAIGDAAAPALFAETWGRSVQATSLIDFFGKWSFKVVFGLISSIIYLLMYAIKFLLIDVIQPIRFSLALFSGFFSIPLGVWPKMGTLGNWLKKLAEISLWPVLFQFLLALSTSAFRSVFEEVNKLDIIAVLEGLTQESHGLNGPLITIIQFLLLCIGYIYMTWQIPSIAASIINSHAVDTLGGMMASTMSSFVSGVVGGISAGSLAGFAPYLGAAPATTAGGGPDSQSYSASISASLGHGDGSSGDHGMNSAGNHGG
ncbi:MAG: hypothetical protein EOO38_30505, partial [Cytophagaceae bacterium]